MKIFNVTRIVISALFICQVFNSSAFCQKIISENISSQGGYFENSEASFNWTVGEMITEDFSSDSVIVMNGSQQSEYVISLITGIETINNSVSGLTLNISPNPSPDVINVQWGLDNASKATIFLFDINGKLLVHQTINEKSGSIEIDMLGYPKAVYVLKFKSNTESKSYNIIKQ